MSGKKRPKPFTILSQTKTVKIDKKKLNRSKITQKFSLVVTALSSDQTLRELSFFIGQFLPHHGKINSNFYSLQKLDFFQILF
jgi:hypothetical protein